MILIETTKDKTVGDGKDIKITLPHGEVIEFEGQGNQGHNRGIITIAFKYATKRFDVVQSVFKSDTKYPKTIWKTEIVNNLMNYSQDVRDRLKSVIENLEEGKYNEVGSTGAV